MLFVAGLEGHLLAYGRREAPTTKSNLPTMPGAIVLFLPDEDRARLVGAIEETLRRAKGR